MKKMRKVADDEKILVFHWWSNNKEMKLKKSSFYRHGKECAPFCALFVHFVCYLFWTFSPWKMLHSSQNKVFRARKCKSVGKAL